MQKTAVASLLCAAIVLALPRYSAGDAEEAAATDSNLIHIADTNFVPHTDIRLISGDTLEEEEPFEPESRDSVQPEGAADSIVLDSGSAQTDSLTPTPPDSARAVAVADSIARASVPQRPAWLYPAVSLEQDQKARQMLHYFYMFDWNNADKTAKKLQKLEKRHRLPPLSYLLMVGMRVLRVQNGEYEHDKDKKELLREIAKLSSKGLELANTEASADSNKAMNLFISGGIKGFLATLEIDCNPINAALNGFAAQKQLEKALMLDSTIKDAYLGLGLFNCILAKAPLIVRGALSLIGKDVTLEKGLNFLRISAYQGCYTGDIARLQLVQFLSPYLGNEAREKMLVLRFLQRQYPGNPYFVFLEIEENLCFHHDALATFSFKRRVKRQIAGFRPEGYSGKRYANLVKWQYLLIDPILLEGVAPDTAFNLRGFSYYPVFLQALGERIAYRRSGAGGRADRARRLRYIKERGTKAVRMLDATQDMPSSQKGFYLWHIRDALRMEESHEEKPVRDQSPGQPSK